MRNLVEFRITKYADQTSIRVIQYGTFRQSFGPYSDEFEATSAAERLARLLYSGYEVTVIPAVDKFQMNTKELDKTKNEYFKDVKVRLTGSDGNAMMIIGKCRLAARRARKPQDEIEAFSKEAMGGDYDNVLSTCAKWFDIS